MLLAPATGIGLMTLEEREPALSKLVSLCVAASQTPSFLYFHASERRALIIADKKAEVTVLPYPIFLRS